MLTTQHFEAPWPARVLSPNSRAHWRIRHAAAKKLRADTGWLAKASGILPPPDGEIRVHLTMCPPDKRARDQDNMLASAKSLLDGLADGLGVDDVRFVPSVSIGPVHKGGKVVVEVRD